MNLRHHKSIWSTLPQATQDETHNRCNPTVAIPITMKSIKHQIHIGSSLQRQAFKKIKMEHIPKRNACIAHLFSKHETMQQQPILKKYFFKNQNKPRSRNEVTTHNP